MNLKDADDGSVLNFTRRFLNWRKAQRPLIVGDVRVFDVAAPLLAFERFDEHASLLVALNFSAERRCFDRGTPLCPLKAPGHTGKVSDQGVTLPPFGAFIGKQLVAEEAS